MWCWDILLRTITVQVNFEPLLKSSSIASRNVIDIANINLPHKPDWRQTRYTWSSKFHSPNPCWIDELTWRYKLEDGANGRGAREVVGFYLFHRWLYYAEITCCCEVEGGFSTAEKSRKLKVSYAYLPSTAVHAPRLGYLSSSSTSSPCVCVCEWVW